MTIVYKPKKILEKMAPEFAIEKLVTQNLTINRAAVTSLERAGILPRKEIERIAIKVIREYKKEYKLEKKSGATNAEAYEDAVKEKRLMIARVQQATLHEITQTIKDNYRGEFYEWLPSTAKVPDEKHMKKYGKKYQLGRGEAPGDRRGCQCGMRILVKSNRLDLSED